MESKLSDHVVEDGFSFEGGGIGERKFRQIFAGIPRNMLRRMLTHFQQRKEWELCRIIRELIKGPDNTEMAS